MIMNLKRILFNLSDLHDCTFIGLTSLICGSGNLSSNVNGSREHECSRYLEELLPFSLRPQFYPVSRPQLPEPDWSWKGREEIGWDVESKGGNRVSSRGYGVRTLGHLPSSLYHPQSLSFTSFSSFLFAPTSTREQGLPKIKLGKLNLKQEKWPRSLKCKGEEWDEEPSTSGTTGLTTVMDFEKVNL